MNDTTEMPSLRLLESAPGDGVQQVRGELSLIDHLKDKDVIDR